MFALTSFLYAYVWVELNFNEHLLSMLLRHRPYVMYRRYKNKQETVSVFLQMFPGCWVRWLQFRGLGFIIMVNAKRYGGIEAMHSDNVARMISQRRVCSPAQKGSKRFVGSLLSATYPLSHNSEKVYYHYYYYFLLLLQCGF